MIRQNILVCTEDDELLSFVSFKENYACDYFGIENGSNIYISTLVLDENDRGNGIDTIYFAKIRR